MFPAAIPESIVLAAGPAATANNTSIRPGETISIVLHRDDTRSGDREEIVVPRGKCQSFNKIIKEKWKNNIGSIEIPEGYQGNFRTDKSCTMIPGPVGYVGALGAYIPTAVSYEEQSFKLDVLQARVNSTYHSTSRHNKFVWGVKQSLAV